MYPRSCSSRAALRSASPAIVANAVTSAGVIERNCIVTYLSEKLVDNNRRAHIRSPPFSFGTATLSVRGKRSPGGPLLAHYTRDIRAVQVTRQTKTPSLHLGGGWGRVGLTSSHA